MRVSESKAYPGERGEVLKPASPLPWRTGEDGVDAERIEDASGEWVGDVFERDRPFVLEACNSYAALRERVARLTEGLQRTLAALDDARNHIYTDARDASESAKALLSPEKGRSTP